MHVTQGSSVTNLGRVLLWAGLLVGPGVWIVQLMTLFALEDIIACTPAATEPGTIWGTSTINWAAIITAITAGLTVAAGAGSFYCWRALRNGGNQTGYQWMAVAGMLTSALFFFVIVVKLAPLPILGRCVGGI